MGIDTAQVDSWAIEPGLAARALEGIEVAPNSPMFSLLTGVKANAEPDGTPLPDAARAALLIAALPTEAFLIAHAGTGDPLISSFVAEGDAVTGFAVAPDDNFLLTTPITRNEFRDLVLRDVGVVEENHGALLDSRVLSVLRVFCRLCPPSEEGLRLPLESARKFLKRTIEADGVIADLLQSLQEGGMIEIDSDHVVFAASFQEYGDLIWSGESLTFRRWDLDGATHAPRTEDAREVLFLGPEGRRAIALPQLEEEAVALVFPTRADVEDSVFAGGTSFWPRAQWELAAEEWLGD